MESSRTVSSRTKHAALLVGVIYMAHHKQQKADGFGFGFWFGFVLYFIYCNTFHHSVFSTISDSICLQVGLISLVIYGLYKHAKSLAEKTSVVIIIKAK